MSDLKATLDQRSRRGIPIGSEQLRQQVAIELAGATPAAPPALRGALIALAVAAVVLVVVGGLALVFGGSEGSVPPADEGSLGVATTSSASTTSSVPEAASAVPSKALDAYSALDWHEVVLPIENIEKLFEGDVEGLTVEGLFEMPDGRLFITGGATTFEHEDAPLVWTSTDALSWERADLERKPAYVVAVASDAGQYVLKAYSYDGAVAGSHTEYWIEYWGSEDGVDWYLLEATASVEVESERYESLFGIEYYPGDVADDRITPFESLYPDPSGQSLPSDCLGTFGHIVDVDGVVTAFCRDIDGNIMSDEPIQVWMLSGGGQWIRLAQDWVFPDADVPVSKLEFGTIRDLGTVLLTDPSHVGTWISTDGRRWVLIPSAVAARDGRVSMASLVDDRIVMIGASRDDALTVWVATKP